MIEIIKEINNRMSALYARKGEIKQTYKQQIAEIDAEIERYNETISIIDSTIQPLVCKTCYGSGEERYIDAAGSRDTRSCKVCGGTGIVKSS